MKGHFFSYFYTWERSGIIDGTFKDIKSADESFTNKIDKIKAPFVDFKINFTKLKLEGGNVFSWEGEALKSNEEIQIAITLGGTIISLLNPTEGITNVTIDKLKERGFKSGKAKITLTKVFKTTQLESTDHPAGGTINYARTVTKEISLE